VKSRQNARWGAGIAVAILVIGIAALFLLAQPLSAASENGVAQRGATAVLAPTTAGVSSPPAKISAGTKTCATGISPEYVAYDPVSKYFYVSNVGGGSISVYKGTCTLVTTITLPAGSVPRGSAYDPANNYIFVADESLAQVYVLSGTTIIQTITSGTFDLPWGVAFDPAGGYLNGSASIIVTNVANNTIDFIASTPSTGTSAVIYTKGVGIDPIAVAYSPVYNALMVVNQGSDNVTSIDATSGAILDASIPVGLSPQGIAFDPATDLTYVTNEGGHNVTVISPTGTQWGSIKVGTNPIAIAFDQKNLDMYVCNFGSKSVYLISSANVVVKKIYLATGSDPAGLAYNVGSGKMDVVGWGSYLVYVEN